MQRRTSRWFVSSLVLGPRKSFPDALSAVPTNIRSSMVQENVDQAAMEVYRYVITMPKDAHLLTGS
jgi:hypothetical protein